MTDTPVIATTNLAPEAGQGYAEVLAEVLGRAEVSQDSHFFDELGANSLVMAHFCAKVRKRADLPTVSMKDIYGHSTIRSLATALSASVPGTGVTTPPSAPSAGDVHLRAGRGAIALCAIAQLVTFVVYVLLLTGLVATFYQWLSGAAGLYDVYLRSVVLGAVTLVAMCVFPVIVKWVLVGRWKAEEFPVWGVTYFRFWTVKVLLHANPMVAFVGTPLYVLYLRALGARIGRGVTILSRSVPVCTDLLTIGDGAVIRKDSVFLCYRAHAGRIQPGPVTVGKDAFVGERTVLEVDTVVGDGAQLGHTSALQPGDAVPVGERWHGSPAVPTEVDYVRVAPRPCGRWRRAMYGFATLMPLLLLYLPFGAGGLYVLFLEVPSLKKLARPSGLDALWSGELVVTAMGFSATAFFGSMILGLLVVGGLPRLLRPAIAPDRAYPLYGIHYSLHRTILRTSNVPFFKALFGDSSYIVPYLQYLGYRMPQVEQTGSNFGIEVKHENPFLTTIGSGTMVADGLSVMNADYSSTSFRVSRTQIGAHNFLGNVVSYPAQGRTGDNCLLATKVMVPLDGKLREDVGLLGSPCFEIPRTVERDRRFDHLRYGEERRSRLAAKNRYNLRTMGVYLVVHWLHLCLLTVLGLTAVALHGPGGAALSAAAVVLGLPLSVLYFLVVERLTLKFGRLEPQLCSIYDPYFWWHERLWKLTPPILETLNGTPYKNLVWRLMGVDLGKRVFDDGCHIPERSLTTIGDDCTLAARTTLQGHSQEDGTFKSDRIRIGNGCTVSTGALVHYGVTVGDGAVIAADSFLMKGEDVPDHARWGGNPATALAEAGRR
jgi:non-ribosomal peptide synthetase-like protein